MYVSNPCKMLRGAAAGQILSQWNLSYLWHTEDILIFTLFIIKKKEQLILIFKSLLTGLMISIHHTACLVQWKWQNGWEASLSVKLANSRVKQKKKDGWMDTLHKSIKNYFKPVTPPRGHFAFESGNQNWYLASFEWNESDHHAAAATRRLHS